jgi:hypothetical protein
MEFRIGAEALVMTPDYKLDLPHGSVFSASDGLRDQIWPTILTFFLIAAY